MREARVCVAPLLACVVAMGCAGSADHGGGAVSPKGACTLANAAELPATGRLVFESGFEVLPSLVGLRPEQATGRTFVDEDSGHVWGVPWLDEDGETYVTHTQTAGWGEEPHQVVEVIPDPDRPGNLVLHTANVSDTVPARSFQARVALRLFPDDANLATRQFYARYRVKLDPALARVRPSERWTWFNVIEVKERQEPPFFFTGVDLVKEAGEPIVWEVKGRHRLPGADAFTTLWEMRNPRAPVPVGEWFTVEYYFRRDAGTGRILFAITAGGTRTVVFDLDHARPETFPAGFTTSEPTATSCAPLEAWEIMKTYVGPPRDVRTILGEPIDAWYDDLEVWTGLPDR